MSNLEATIHEIYARQPKELYESEAEYVEHLDFVARELFKKQPRPVSLSEDGYRLFLIAVQRNHHLSLSEVERRLQDFPNLVADFNRGPQNG